MPLEYLSRNSPPFDFSRIAVAVISTNIKIMIIMIIIIIIIKMIVIMTIITI